ncbi:MAG: hypothetical protein IKM20_08865 [Erysipelotrichales bacterium]|nr:hypothetical protein [Erysipelotrichales bacterium]
MSYLDMAIFVALFFISTICLIYSITTFFARKPVRLFGAKFKNKDIRDAEVFNRTNALVLLLMALPGFLGGTFFLLSPYIGKIVAVIAYVIIFPICVLFFYLNKNAQTKNLIRSVMFSISKNSTIFKFEFFKRSTFIEAFKYINIGGSEDILHVELKKRVMYDIWEFIEHHEIKDWNGFAKQTGDPDKGLEWKIKIVYDNGDVVFAFGKDAFPINGKPIISQFNDLLNELFMKMKR